MGRHSIPGPDETPDEAFDGVPAEPAEAEPTEAESRKASDEPDDAFDTVAEPPVAASPPPLTPPPLPADDFNTGRLNTGHFADGSWQGGHRSAEIKRRGISVGVIVALVLVVVVVGAVILWRFFGNALSSRSDAAAAAKCTGTDIPVAVVADPSIADNIRELAERYNKTAGPIGDHCFRLGVTAADSDDVVAGFAGKWPGELGQQPAMWIPASSIATARLQASVDPKIVSDSRSLVSTPVLLAIKPQLKPALSDKNWAALPGLQSNPMSLDTTNMPGWGSLRLALPTGGDADGTYLAAEAIAAASAPPNAPASAGVSAVNTLMATQPKLPDSKLSTAMDTLLASGDPAVAPVHAVVTTEQQLYQRAKAVPDAKNVVAAWLPPGPTALADYPMASLTGSWLDEAQMTAANEFKKFLQKADQLKDLAEAGFRAGDVPMPKSDVTGFAGLSKPLSIGDGKARANFADSVSTPAGGTAVTIMLDQSMPGQDGAKTRLANVVAALRSRLASLPSNAVVGLWTFDGVEGRSEVATGPLSDQVNGQQRSAALNAALDKQFSSNGGAVAFTTFKMIYDGALAGFRPGMKNSVLVITEGPHTDQSMDGAALQDYLRKTFDPARPVAVNVVDFGADPDRATWGALAQASGGAYQNFATSDSVEMTTAVSTFLG
ncbi:MAG: hypothetical protein QOH57_485 [Mycobacterium sp.]|jgi:hypothetical protein|nr:hypothetical protein [Mycobacterium sp.]